MRLRQLTAVAILVILSATTGPKLWAEAPSPLVASDEKPALDVFESSISGVAASRLPLPKGGSIRQSALDADFAYTRRLALKGPWYFAFGPSYEAFFFSKTAEGLPERLQGVSGIFALQYIVSDHVAASIEVRPGFYFGRKLTSEAWDVPITAYAPIPLRSNVFAVVGARYSGLQNPPVIPLGGLIWLIQDDLRLEAIFPQSRLVYSPSDRWEYQLEAEITGDGFRGDRDASLSPKFRSAVIQYSEYRAAAGFSFSPTHGSSIGLDIGYVFERSFDYFRVGRELRSGGSPFVQLQGSLEF